MSQKNTTGQQKARINTPPTRDLDPNVSQRRASNPNASVWVSASAGTGKTKVLTDRVLRLLLPRANGAPGTPAHKILGITFTKAAASEMALRISDRLALWAIMPIESLESDLNQLLNKKPTSWDVLAARKLFADVIDTPGGLKIMTIHSFCQSVLGRFPLEANLPPYFSVLEEHQSSELMQSAQRNVIKRAEHDKSTPLYSAFLHIASTINEEQCSALIKDIVTERRQFEDLLTRHFNINGLYTALCTHLNIPPGLTPHSLLKSVCGDENFDVQKLKGVCAALGKSNKKTDQDSAQKIGAWLTATIGKRIESFNCYKSAFLTQKNEIKKNLATKDVQKENPEALETLLKEAQRILDISEQIKALRCAALTRDLLLLAAETLKEYETLKRKDAVLDFDDLILKTSALIKGEEGPNANNASWVLYKMDQGLEHILVDEAQDTNPDQWSIIEALCGEFFTGAGSNEATRTVFVVGDEKQSIYSFQRASPEEFARMQMDFKQKIENAQEVWESVQMGISFRSTQSVLRAVDAVFSIAELRKGLSESDITHQSFRTGQAGLVELWPLFENDTRSEINLWDPPTNITETPSSQAKLAEHIASKIEHWINSKEILPARARAIKAGDIMILMRTRTALVHTITRALKAKNIPVSGSDRMILNDQIVIEDLVALAQFALLPSDDLNLACLLKSPIIGISEEALFNLAHGRKNTLWESLKVSKHTEILQYLKDIIELGRDVHPFEFFSHILQTACPADEQSALRAIKSRLGEDAIDPINEFLDAALNYERTHIASLQGFIFWQTQRQDQIKREMKESDGQVRIMTVHGSKGLQAPIVIMPDTLRTTTSPPGQIDKRLIWPDKSKISVPLWSPRKEDDCTLFSTQMAGLDERLDEEYRRLLYVAMTRAEDRLYVTGHRGHKTPLENSWYYFVQKGLESLPETEKIDGEILRLHNPQTREVSAKETIEGTDDKSSSNAPPWLHQKAKEEQTRTTALSPSRPSEEEIISSPLDGQNNYRFRRGNVTHKLLEFLPDIAPENQKQTAQSFLARFAQDLPTAVQESIVEEVSKILEHSDFAPIFGKHSRAEVPISGNLSDGRLISGQIDRLLITDNEIWIVDYKTNRPSPKAATDIPVIYQKQMQAYADTLRAIYPKHAIKAALLWTDEPKLMPILIN